MSHTDPLPSALAGLESQLRDLPLPSGKLDRDETLYRAGWAAAEAQCRGLGASRFWPVISGVLAASVLVMGVLLVRQDGAQQVVYVGKTQHTQADRQHGPADESVLEIAERSNESWLANEFARHFSPVDNSMLAVRDRALQGILPELSRAVDQSDVPIQRAKTRRELLSDLLERNINS